ncbi:hypothetical protein MW871_03730 [Flavobacterium sp. I-SCBP12n]|uniref:Uncharacterized protein n=1 Tax=Flavobacterium pygoscelis TaxID=2893176 RepID=A0A9X2BK13_9FLAO|nr:hypothetical protein [Flavobacterium pygoscelis]MCK8140994.1 hypothetical protein [Flavobacterium pygoscelis]
MNKAVITSTKSFLILVMAFLLLVAPCSFRNNLESSLEISTTKPLNPVKSASTNSNNCSALEINSEKKETKIFANKIIKKSTFLTAVAFTNLYRSEKKQYLLANTASSWIPPYYILYKRLKIFDLNDLNFA